LFSKLFINKKLFLLFLGTIVGAIIARQIDAGRQDGTFQKRGAEIAVGMCQEVNLADLQCPVSQKIRVIRKALYGHASLEKTHCTQKVFHRTQSARGGRRKNLDIDIIFFHIRRKLGLQVVDRGQFFDWSIGRSVCPPGPTVRLVRSVPRMYIQY
jgi:hypothetical protein